MPIKGKIGLLSLAKFCKAQFPQEKPPVERYERYTQPGVFSVYNTTAIIQRRDLASAKSLKNLLLVSMPTPSPHVGGLYSLFCCTASSLMDKQIAPNANPEIKPIQYPIAPNWP